MPIRISMIRPMPFCPSFEPCAKLTAVQVRISTARIQNGGGALPSGGRYRRSFLTMAFKARSNNAAPTNPTSGEIKRDLPTAAACCQSTPLVAVDLSSSSLARPTPMIDPISVCELDDGRPNDHVARFQTIAATRSANTIEKPAELPTCRISSTGKSEMIAKATAPLDVSTPRKLKAPDHATAKCGSSECV